MGSMHPDLAILETHFGRQASLNIEKASKECQNVLKEKKLYLKERKKNDSVRVHMEKKVSNFQILMFVILRQKILLCPWTLEMWTQAASRYFSSVYVFHALYISSCSLLNMRRAQQQTQKMKKNVVYPLKKENSQKKN